MNTPHHEEENIPPPTQTTDKKYSLLEKWYTTIRSIPRSFIITCIVFLLIIIGIIFHYERKLDREYGYMRYSGPKFSIYHSEPLNDFIWIDRGWDDHWHDFDRQMEMMERRYRKMMKTIEKTQESQEIPLEGKYSGTQIINGDSFTYTIDIATGSVTGVYSGTASGTLASLQKSLESLGYRVEKKETGYTFGGKIENVEKLMELFR